MNASVVFTIVSKNYVHFARTLMQSIAIHHPEWRRVVLLVDENNGDIDPAKESFELVEVSALPLPDARKFRFRYSILELNTAVKAWMFEWLFERGANEVVYLDPDIFVYRPLAEVQRAWTEGSFMVLTPHLTGPLDEEHRPNELDILLAGTYNLGFLGLRRDPQVREFLSWWQSKLQFNCVVDHPRGLFVDQKWLDLAPGLYERVAVLRHEGYNVAYWNLAHRELKRDGAHFSVNSVPLVFYHFSGLDAKAPQTISKYQNRFRLSDLGVLADVVLAYSERLLDNAKDVDGFSPYAFGSFDNGERVPECIRKLYRVDHEFQKAAGDNPFHLACDYLNRPVGRKDAGAVPITVLMQHVWNSRVDLQQAFPRPFDSDRERFAEWYVKMSPAELSIPSACVRPVAEALRLLGTSLGVPDSVDGASCGIQHLLELDDAEFVMEAYRTLLKRPADPDGLRHHLSNLRAGRSKAEVLWRLRFSMEGRAAGTSIGDFWLALGRAWMRPHPHRRTVGATTPKSVTALSTASEASHGLSGTGHHGNSPTQWSESARRRFGRSDYLGFYDWGDQHEGLVWMGRSASVRIPNGAPRRVSIEGLYDGAHHKRASGRRETTLAVALNDEHVGEIVLGKTGPFSKSFDLPERPLDFPAYLSFTASQVFVPAAIGLNADPRELSLRVSRVSLDGTALLDFSRSPSPYGWEREDDTSQGLNIVGYVRSEHGIGESARLCAQSAEAVGIPFVMFDFNAGNSARTQDARWETRIRTDNPYSINLFHVNADQMTLVRDVLKENFFADRLNIGYWHWELPDFPERFKSGFAFLDEVWVPTTFVMDAVSPKSPVPVVRIPHSVQIRLDGHPSRSKFGLPEGIFLFLTMYDMHSAQGRKNPKAVVEAFWKAFPHPDDVGLVLKVQNTSSHPEEFAELKREIEGRPNCFVIDRTLLRSEVYELEASCDCFVSLHRSEGFGLGLAESMFLGKPAIGTNWSGNVDFMNDRNSCPVDYRLVTLDRDFGPYYKKGNVWADPDIDHAAWYMSKVVNDAPWRAWIAAEGMQTIRTLYSPERIGSLYRDRLRRLLA